MGGGKLSRLLERFEELSEKLRRVGGGDGRHGVGDSCEHDRLVSAAEGCRRVCPRRRVPLVRELADGDLRELADVRDEAGAERLGVRAERLRSGAGSLSLASA